MACIRIQLISDQLNHLKSVWDQVMPSVDDNGHIRHRLEYCEECKLRWIGCMTQYLAIPYVTKAPSQAQSPALMPIPKVQDYPWSVNNLRGHLVHVESKLVPCGECSSTPLRATKTLPGMRSDGAGAPRLVLCTAPAAALEKLSGFETRYHRLRAAKVESRRGGVSTRAGPSRNATP